MEARQAELKGRLAEILQEASHVACQLQKLEQGRGTPHYDQIESAAHDVGQQLSRMVQQNRAGDLSVEHPVETKCPDCRNKCPVTTKSRQVTSLDGPVELMETVAHCTTCRRSFFPSASSVGAGLT